MPKIIEMLAGPILDLFRQRQARKAAKETAKAKLTQSRSDSEYKVEFTDQEWEAIAAGDLDKTWRDEYVTVSVMSVFNIIVVGGILSAFGYPQVLTGIGYAVNALTTSGVDVGFLMETVVLAGVGLSVWRKV